MVIDWNDCTPLTRFEFDAFIGSAIPFLMRMEDKNGWDFFVNDRSIRWFCLRFMDEALELNGYEDYQWYYPKLNDIDTIYRILSEADWTAEDETLRKDKGSEIWKLVLNKINAIADTVF